MINKLWDIGWADPFPDKECGGAPQGMADMNLPLSPNDLVYSQGRYSPDYSPSVIYIPKKAIMFKLARACLACQSVDELWFYVENDKDKPKDSNEPEED